MSSSCTQQPRKRYCTSKPTGPTSTSSYTRPTTRPSSTATLATLLATTQSTASTDSPHRLIGVYTQTYDLIRDSKPFVHAAIDPCTYRWLDFWGTPEEQNHIHHNLQQFITPYDNGYNGLLGLIVQPPTTTTQPQPPRTYYSPRICLWGKEVKYFPRDRLDALQYVLDHLPVTHHCKPTVHATIGGNMQRLPCLVAQRGRAAQQRGVSPLPRPLHSADRDGRPHPRPDSIPSGRTRRALHQLRVQRQSKTFWMNGRMRVKSQHDEAVTLLPPDRVTTVNWEGKNGAARLTEAVAKVCWRQRRRDGSSGRWTGRRVRGGKGFIHPTHQLDNVTERLARNLFDPKICPWHADEWE